MIEQRPENVAARTRANHLTDRVVRHRRRLFESTLAQCWNLCGFTVNAYWTLY
jgi:hypothetical protein